MYVQLQRKLQALGEEEDKSEKNEPAKPNEQGNRHTRIRMQQQAGGKRAWGDQAVIPLLALIQDQMIPHCGPPLNGVEQQIARMSQPDAVDVNGASTFTHPLISLPGTQVAVSTRLSDETKLLVPDSPDLALVDAQLRVDLPPAPCDGFYLWFTDVHIQANVTFGAQLESGVADVSFSFRSDLNLPQSAPFAVSPLTPTVAFDGPGSHLVPRGAVAISGDATPFETSFQVMEVLQVTQGDRPALRFYTRGTVLALDGVTHLRFGHGVFDSWAIQAGAGFGESVKGVRYMTFGPQGLGV